MLMFPDHRGVPQLHGRDTNVLKGGGKGGKGFERSGGKGAGKSKGSTPSSSSSSSNAAPRERRVCITNEAPQAQADDEPLRRPGCRIPRKGKKMLTIKKWIHRMIWISSRMCLRLSDCNPQRWDVSLLDIRRRPQAGRRIHTAQLVAVQDIGTRTQSVPWLDKQIRRARARAMMLRSKATAKASLTSVATARKRCWRSRDILLEKKSRLQWMIKPRSPSLMWPLWDTTLFTTHRRCTWLHFPISIAMSFWIQLANGLVQAAPGYPTMRSV